MGPFNLFLGDDGARSQRHPCRILLTEEQLDRLRACARGISLRFEKPQIVDALVAAGLVEKNIAGVVTISAKGRQYLSTHEY